MPELLKNNKKVSKKSQSADGARVYLLSLELPLSATTASRDFLDPLWFDINFAAEANPMARKRTITKLDFMMDRWHLFYTRYIFPQFAARCHQIFVFSTYATFLHLIEQLFKLAATPSTFQITLCSELSTGGKAKRAALADHRGRIPHSSRRTLRFLRERSL